MTRSKLFAIGLMFVVTFPVSSEEPKDEGAAEKSIAALIGELTSADKGKRLLAIEALAGQGEEAAEAIPALLEQLDFDDPQARGAAARALATIGAKADKVVPALIGRFSDEGFMDVIVPRRKSIPLFAIYGLAVAEFGDKAVEPLMEALRSDSHRVYLAAAIGLEAVGEPAVKATPQLIAMLESDDAFKRRAAAGAIRGIGSGAAEAIPALTKMLYEEDSNEQGFHSQYWACRALGAIGPDAAVATGDLLDRLSNGTVSVRRNAAIALGMIGPDIGPEAAAELIRVVDEEYTAPVREEAVIALGKLKPFAKKSVPALKKALSDPNFPPRTHAARSLWLLTGDAGEALPTLTESLDDLTYFQHAVQVLAEMGPEAAPAVDRLIEGLDEPDPDDRAAVVYALARIGVPAAKVEAAVRPLLEDDAAHVREAARVALENLGGPQPD